MTRRSARDEIRAAGLVCPSCDVNLADVPNGHRLRMVDAGRQHEAEPLEPATAICAPDGKLVTLDFEAFRATANIMVAEDYWAGMAELESQP